MKIDIQIKFDPYQRLNEKYQEYALKDAERQMAEKLYEALEPYIKREIDQEHIRLTLDGIEKEELGFDISKYETRKFEILRLEKVEHGQRND